MKVNPKDLELRYYPIDEKDDTGMHTVELNQVSHGELILR